MTETDSTSPTLNPPGAFAAETRVGASRRSRPHLCIFDMAVVPNSPVGSCVLAEVLGLADHLDITVLSASCAASMHPNVRWLQVPVPARPLLLRYMLFHLLAPLVLAWHRLRGLPRPDWVQASSGQYARADVAYAHFCHRAYLDGPWKASTARGLRRLLRLLNHRFNAFAERRCLRHARLVVVPSRGLEGDLRSVYPHVAGRIVTLSNPVDLDHYRPPATLDRVALRRELGLPQDAILFTFVALGDFDRKGLGLVLPALASLGPESNTHVVVVGGHRDEIGRWASKAAAAGVAHRAHFVGMQADVRPYLWACDAFAFPSAYETFSLAILQAAAAGQLVIVSRGLHGPDEFIVDGEGGWVVDRTVEAVAAGMRLVVEDPGRRAAMGRMAQAAVQRYSRETFVQRWRDVYARLAPAEG